MHTGHFFPFNDLRKVIALDVGFFRVLQHLGRAVGNAEITLLATLGNDVHPPDRHLRRCEIDWLACGILQCIWQKELLADRDFPLTAGR